MEGFERRRNTMVVGAGEETNEILKTLLPFCDHNRPMPGSIGCHARYWARGLQRMNSWTHRFETLLQSAITSECISITYLARQSNPPKHIQSHDLSPSISSHPFKYPPHQLLLQAPKTKLAYPSATTTGLSPSARVVVPFLILTVAPFQPPLPSPPSPLQASIIT